MIYQINLSKCPNVLPSPKSPLEAQFYDPEDFVDQARTLVVQQEAQLCLIRDIIQSFDTRRASKHLVRELQQVL